MAFFYFYGARGGSPTFGNEIVSLGKVTDSVWTGN